MFKRIIMISGAPRSGTSWIGQILDSAPCTAYRFQPLFSWAFKNAINANSSRDEYSDFFKRVYYSSDDFLLQTDRRDRGIYPVFENKDKEPNILVLKMVRYHFLLPKMLQFYHQSLKVICVTRHPCGVINSWINNPKEFPAGADPAKEWNLATVRNRGKPEEYWGYDGWRRATDIFLDIKRQFDDNVYLLMYEKMVSNTMDQVKKLFNFLDIPIRKQTIDFITSCHRINKDDPYSVFKDRRTKDRWKKELNPLIHESIIRKMESHFSELFKELK